MTSTGEAAGPVATPRWRRLLMVVCVVSMLFPAAAGAADPRPDPRADLDKVNDELDHARSSLRSVERRTRTELAELDAVNDRRRVLQSELDALTGELTEAQLIVDAAQAAVDRTSRALAATEADLNETRGTLASQHDVFVARARISYMYGGMAGYSSFVVDVANLQEFNRGMRYARVVLKNDQERVESLDALERRVEATAAQLAELRGRREQQRQVAAAERDRVGVLVDRQAAVTREATVEADRQRLLLAQLESNRESYLAMVDALQAESRQIELELRRRAEAQARREAQRRQAAERAAARAQARAAAEPASSSGASAQSSAATSAPPAAPASSAPSGGQLAWPASGPKTSDYGWRVHPIFGTSRFHAGIDIGAGYGATISAAESGVVVSAGWQGGYGNTVVIDHGGGLATLYAHQSRLGVSAGQQVVRGETIGYVGSTGYSTGPHLHFEVRVNGATRNPMDYL